MSGSRRAAFAIAASIAVTGAVVAGLLALGSPGAQRARRLDARRLEDLRSLAGGIEHAWRTQRTLPRSLEELPAGFESSRRDPETGQEYEYSVRGESRYQLCATFDRDNTEDAERPWPGRDPIALSIWTHGAGRSCFELEPSSEPTR